MSGIDLEALHKRLIALSDARYAAFSEGLTPGAEGHMLGVRVPELRKIAKEISHGTWREFLEATREHAIFEYRMLHAMVLGGAECDIDEKIDLADRFLPYVDNWAVCDALCSCLKPRKGERNALFDFVCACAGSDIEFRKRFGLVMLMSCFRDPPCIDRTMAVYRAFRHDGYYARMGAAWGLATLWLYDRDGALSILQGDLWDDFTHANAIQKLCDSRRISDSDKALARSLRRSERNKR